jgi:hypothetical protein
LYLVQQPGTPLVDAVDVLDIENDEAALEEPTFAITYNLHIFSLEELAKARGRKPQARFAELSSKLEWKDFSSQVKIKIADVLFPRQAVVDDNAFKLAFSMVRLVPVALPLASQADYEYLIKNARKLNDPKVKITVEQVEKGIDIVSIGLVSTQNTI